MGLHLEINNGYEDIFIEVWDYDYEPAELMTWDYPGCDAGVMINEVHMVDERGNDLGEICLLNGAEDDVAIAQLEEHEGEILATRYWGIYA